MARVMAKTLAGALLALAAAVPASADVPAAAGADVKAGWDAWQRGDYRTAVEEWRGPAIAGDADAQFNLGQAYKLGRGVPVDPGLAESWFRKAALQKHPLAEDNYGLALYQSGRRPEALPWLEKSVARGEPRAELVLGTMLFNGDGVTRDVPRAYALMTRASQAGLTSASQTLAQMDSYVTAADREKGTALARTLATQQPAQTVGADGRMLVISDVPAPPSAEPAAPLRQAGGRKPAPVEVAQSTPAPKPVAAAKPAPKPVATAKPAPAPKPKPAPVAARPALAGRYRVQLGAFREEGNARALWTRVGQQIGGAPSFSKARGFTRLVGGAFASEAEAKRACRVARVSCMVMR